MQIKIFCDKVSDGLVPSEKAVFIEDTYGKIIELHVFDGCISDNMLLVEFIEEPSFFKFLDLENYLSNLFKIKVDLVMKDTLKPYIGKQILSEVIYV